MNPTKNRHYSLNSLYLSHIGILLTGLILGLVLSYLLTGLHWQSPNELALAKKLGITSLTTLSGYSKSRDIITYLSLLFFPIACSAILWSLWSWKKHGMLKENLFPRGSQDYSKGGPGWNLCLPLVAALYLLIPFDINNFYRPFYSESVGAWPFLGEEGEHLAWIQSILSGGVHGRDFFCLYGPMLIYPLAWLMKLFGPTITLLRHYTFYLNLIAFGIYPSVA